MEGDWGETVCPPGLLQAQRDYFGAHTYKRLDKNRGEMFHTHWIRERTL